MSNKALPLMKVCTAGSVDDGKSTLIGRLLLETNSLYKDQKEELTNKPLAYITDGLKAEREQGITIDVAYRFFSTEKRQFILADTPGHFQYTRNMATGASQADMALLLVDAKKGLTEQSRRHATILSLLGIKRLCLIVNKIDLVDFSEQSFLQIKKEFSQFAKKLQVTEIAFIPTSALQGDNIKDVSKKTPWYKGPSLLTHLEETFFEADLNLIDFRYPIQYVVHSANDFRGYCGQILSGQVRVGDSVTLLPSMQKTKVKTISLGQEELQQAQTPQSITLSFTDPVDLSRGDQVVKDNNLPQKSALVDTLLIWFDLDEINLQKKYWMQIGTRVVSTHIKKLHYTMDTETLSRQEQRLFKQNDIGRLTLHCEQPIYWDPYEKNRRTGSFILIDPVSNNTVAAGMITDRNPTQRLTSAPQEPNGGSKPKNIQISQPCLTKAQRESHWNYTPQTLWLTGLPASGKSTLSSHLEEKIFAQKHSVLRLDGDNLRFGLNNNLGFSPEDRSENIRRTAEAAKLLNDAGVSVIVSLISPYEKDRQAAKSIIGKKHFIEVFVNTPLEICEKRDPKGLYQKAREGQIQGFTGVDAPYESPQNPDLEIDTSRLSLDDCCSTLLKEYSEKSKKV